MDAHSSTLYPDMRFTSLMNAKAGALCAQAAWELGYKEAKRELREWLLSDLTDSLTR